MKKREGALQNLALYIKDLLENMHYDVGISCDGTELRIGSKVDQHQIEIVFKAEKEDVLFISAQYFYGVDGADDAYRKWWDNISSRAGGVEFKREKDGSIILSYHLRIPGIRGETAERIFKAQLYFIIYCIREQFYCLRADVEEAKRLGLKVVRSSSEG